MPSVAILDHVVFVNQQHNNGSTLYSIVLLTAIKTWANWQSIQPSYLFRSSVIIPSLSPHCNTLVRRQLANEAWCPFRAISSSADEITSLSMIACIWLSSCNWSGSEWTSESSLISSTGVVNIYKIVDCNLCALQKRVQDHFWDHVSVAVYCGSYCALL